MGGATIIDTQSEPGSWAEALRYPSSIRVLETLPPSEPGGQVTGAAVPRFFQPHS
ncbi:hypothetical protein UFOVP152_34 [uncultured Caudovirales phage]|uniref:Uncharacterized protein n=1 Tax=uncultured Caudovirales phage TaxID=2100421 RepID=A0A6J7W8D0_9CAUD|nr:hypothetical protein UFOVP152_34 [uncultured Caudovirales phage]